MKLFKFNPRKPVESFAAHFKVLTICGLWPPVNASPTVTRLYNIYSWCNLTFWLYFFVYTQFMYFFEIRDLTDLANSLYFFLIQIVLIPKLYYLKKNGNRIRTCIEKLKSELFISENESEDELVDAAIFRTVLFHRMEISMCYSCIIVWSITVFIPGSGKMQLIPAKFPFDTSHGYAFALTFIYQFIAVSFSAFTHMTMDTLATGLFFHAASQVNRLGNKLTNRNNYQELMKCIKHHKAIIAYTSELEDVFKESLFAQLMSTLVILCMTEFLLMNFQKGNSLMFLNVFSYFLIVTFQIWQLCYTGNEVFYATLVEKAYFSNFLVFDIKTSKTLVTFMERLKRDIDVTCGFIFKVTLNINTFLAIMRASYSYFAVLQSVDDRFLLFLSFYDIAYIFPNH
uniref:Odorant receptor n=1 Tax=Culicoides sonorensis TaxID=179676 RepID=A0A336K6E5_CULSO